MTTLTIAQAAQIKKCSSHTINKWIRDKSIDSEVVEGKTRVIYNDKFIAIKASPKI